jgi:hypothetical protein
VKLTHWQYENLRKFEAACAAALAHRRIAGDIGRILATNVSMAWVADCVPYFTITNLALRHGHQNRNAPRAIVKELAEIGIINKYPLRCRPNPKKRGNLFSFPFTVNWKQLDKWLPEKWGLGTKLNERRDTFEAWIARKDAERQAAQDRLREQNRRRREAEAARDAELRRRRLNPTRQERLEWLECQANWHRLNLNGKDVRRRVQARAELAKIEAEIASLST